MYNPIVNMGHAVEERISHLEDNIGPLRPKRAGENVREDDVVIDPSGDKLVPQRTYGGRRRRGPLPEGVPIDRRQSQNTIRRP